MAYPGENEHKEYMDYVIQMQEDGQQPLSKEEWRKTRMKPVESLLDDQ